MQYEKQRYFIIPYVCLSICMSIWYVFFEIWFLCCYLDASWLITRKFTATVLFTFLICSQDYLWKIKFQLQKQEQVISTVLWRLFDEQFKLRKLIALHLLKHNRRKEISYFFKIWRLITFVENCAAKLSIPF